MLVLKDREMVDGKPDVAAGILEVDHSRMGAADRPVGSAVIDVDANHQQAMEGLAALGEIRTLAASDFAEGVFKSFARQRRVEVSQPAAA